ncbi:Uncharacterized protein TPAR_02537 [Tolypocladium paradoxum]|uniref:Uncharacterized protein n=1 Tax=Tolypocladium paradoxum TaxID=94208 RepID=A0A2S4L496_9HYPO|nr:Uncharacterized protein TPAR_02537 [Tolypocladium paradoxum]
MAATDASGWGHGLQPMNIQPLPASFAPFFPTADERAMTAQKEPATTRPQDVSWSDFLGAQGAYRRPPAWTRVATEAHASTRAVGTIMKKIGLPTRHVARTRFLERTASQPAMRTGEQEDQNDKCELPPSKRQRLASFEPSQEGHETVGGPQSEAEMASVFMRAKVDLANRVLAAELEQLRKGFKNQVTPAKRRIDRKFRFEEDGIVGGFRLRSYDLIWPVLSKVALLGDEQIDVRTASIAEISANLQDMRRDPRCHTALRGLPELSNVADVTELESTLALMRPPESPAETTSPTKRRARPTSPVEPRASRLSDTLVKLLPASSPKAEPSPTKSASTPFADTPAARRIVATSPLRSTASTRSVHVAPAQQTSPTGASNGPRVFRAPSYDDSSSSLQSIDESSPLQPSPSRLSRPVAPTPSRWNRAESSSPQSKTPCRRGSGLGLVDAIPPSTPQLPVSTLKGIDANDFAPFNFGPISPSFNSPSWLGGSVAMGGSRRDGSLKKSSHRKSEPLIRSCYRNQAAARQSLSPQKLSFSNGLFLSKNNPSLQSPHIHLVSATMDADQRHGPDTPETSQPPDVSMGGTVTPAISWAKMTGRAPPTAAVRNTPLTNAAGGPKNVFNVDMRQNLDIFGRSQAASPKRRASAIDQLGQIAEECCAGRADVVVTRQHGRLFVRFKLPVEHASKFPESQGFHESRFATTPSAISSSPRITFKGHYPSVDAAVASPSPSPAQPSPAAAAAPDETVFVPDFAPSPPAQSLSVDETAQPGVDDAFQTSSGSSDDFTVEEHSTAIPWLEKLGRDTLANESNPSQGTLPMANGQSDSWLTKGLRTPTINDVAIAGLASNGTAKSPALQQMSTPTADAMDVIPTDAPNITTSFTPVNQLTPQNGVTQPGSASGASQRAQHDPGSARGHIQQHDYDSPGRAYMREFIKRSKPKRLSATETGSPIAPPAKRQPLGVKSPNTESPQKGKRKVGSEKLDAQSPLKNRDVPAPKRSRRHGKTTRRAEADHDMEPGTMTEQGAARVADDADDGQCNEEMGDAPATRRSSRLRSQGKAVAAPKSSIPTPIKFGGRSGAGRATALKSTSRTEQQDLTYQTRINTRKNRGNAEYPAQFLARQPSDEMEADDAAGEGVEAAESCNGRRCVGWKDPIESHRDDKTKRGRPPKARATQGNPDVAKPTKASAAAQRQRTAKAAANLGMSANGTPARAGRVTRSSARIQK